MEVMSAEHTSHTYFTPPSVLLVTVFFLITPMTTSVSPFESLSSASSDEASTLFDDRHLMIWIHCGDL